MFIHFRKLISRQKGKTIRFNSALWQLLFCGSAIKHTVRDCLTLRAGKPHACRGGPTLLAKQGKSFYPTGPRSDVPFNQNKHLRHKKQETLTPSQIILRL